MEGKNGEWPSLYENEHPMIILSSKDLGPGNQGGFGPNTDIEADVAKDVAKREYVAEATREIHCMDDRFRGSGCQLPGGLLIVEMASDFMNPEAEILAWDEMVRHKTEMLVQKGRPVILHGDTTHGQGGCAANAFQCETLIYNADPEHKDLVLDLAWSRLQMMELDRLLQKGDVRQAIDTGGYRAKDKGLWRNIAADQVVRIALDSGAEYEEFEGSHNVACSRTDLSENGFNSGAFRSSHMADDGEPLGVFSITLGAYKNQLIEDGFEVSEVAKKLMHTVLFSIGLLKIATKDDFQDIVVM